MSLFQIITMSKLKLGIISTLPAPREATPFVIQHQAMATLREENSEWRRQADQQTGLALENQRLSTELAQVKKAAPLAEGQLSELLRLRGELAALRNQKQGTAQSRPASALASKAGA